MRKGDFPGVGRNDNYLKSGGKLSQSTVTVQLVGVEDKNNLMEDFLRKVRVLV